MSADGATANSSTPLSVNNIADVATGGVAETSRHEQMLAKLRVREEERERQRALAAQQAAAPETRTDSQVAREFLKQFESDHKAIQTELDASSQLAPDAVAQELVSLKDRIAALQKAVALATHLLPTYDRKQCNVVLDELLGKIEQAKASSAPKKKFAFARPAKKATAGTAAAAAGTDGSSSASAASSSADSSAAASSSTAVSSAMQALLDKYAAFTPVPFPGLHKKKNQVIHMGVYNSVDSITIPSTSSSSSASASATATTTATAAACESSSSSLAAETVSPSADASSSSSSSSPSNSSSIDGKDLWVSDLDTCAVSLTAPLTALRIDKLRRCVVLVGCVAGSLHIEDVQDSIIVVACRQVRIHHAHNCDFYLQVQSRPIMEHSDGLRFAPYVLFYPELAAHVAKSGLTFDTSSLLRGLQQQDGSSSSSSSSASGEKDATADQQTNEEEKSISHSGAGAAAGARNNLWSCVDDFNWLRTQESPNWRILPEKERLSQVAPTDALTILMSLMK